MSAPLSINILTGSMFLLFSNAFIDYKSAKVPKMVFFLLIYSPQESKKFIVFESAIFEASHKSIIWLLARLWQAIFIRSSLSSFFLLLDGWYFLIRLIIAVEPSLEAINNGIFPSLSFESKIEYFSSSTFLFIALRIC